MSIASEITRLNNAKAAIKQSLANKGVEVSDEAKLDEYPALIDSIEVGGEGGDPFYEDLYNLRTSNGTDMAYMFYGCTASSLDLSKFDTSKATSMNYMFSNCTSLTELDLSNFDTSKVISMEYMFSDCYNLSSLNVNNFVFNTCNLNKMFNGCSALSSLDLSNWDTSQVTNMNWMFRGCSSLWSLDIRNFDMSNINDLYGIFIDCTQLSELYLNNCSYDTVNKIINSSDFPADNYGVIYCSLDVYNYGLTPPGNWTFEAV